MSIKLEEIEKKQKKAIASLLDTVIVNPKKGLKRNKGKIMTVVELPKRFNNNDRINKKISSASNAFTNRILKILQEELNKK